MAKEKAICDYALFMGATVDNASFSKEQWTETTKNCCALKMYLEQTFGPINLKNDFCLWGRFFESLPTNKVICVHAEHTNVAATLLLAQFHKRHVHICHVSKRDEILMVREAKQRGISVSCEVCPHHLFLTQQKAEQMLAERGLPASCTSVRPALGTDEDVAALWENLEFIDCFATDHAPHTLDEKTGAAGSSVPPGFPGLESMLPLLLTAVSEGIRVLIVHMHTFEVPYSKKICF